MKELKLILLVSLIFIVACSVNNVENINELKKEIQEKEKIIQQQQEQIKKLQEELNSYSPKGVSYKVQLSDWTQDEIAKVLAKYDPDFIDTSWFKYDYDNEGKYYDLIGPIFPYDPFNQITYSKRDRELNVNSLRIFDIDPGRKEEAEEEYTEYLTRIQKNTVINPKLVCIEQKECRNINLVICNSEGNTFYSWYSYPYLFETRNDNGKTLTAFKKFYCELS